jgi:predicted tellurium resistance membrane protein TerC
MIDSFFDPEAWAALITLTVLETVLGIDNVVFLSVIVSRIPEDQARRLRRIGLSLALVFRILLLCLLAWIIGREQVVFSVRGVDFAWRNIILIAGGLFLIGKATHEIHRQLEEPDEGVGRAASAYFWIITQIVAIDLVFSIDSIIVAIGMAQDLKIIVAAIMISCFIMYVFSGQVARFVANNPTTKMLALAFLVLIGVALVADGVNFHIPRGYIYFAIGFAALVEFFNVLAKRGRAKGR